MPRHDAAVRAAGAPPSWIHVALAMLIAWSAHPTAARADWDPNGNPVTLAPGPQSDLVFVPVPAGGGIACWRDGRDPSRRQIYLGRVAPYFDPLGLGSNYFYHSPPWVAVAEYGSGDASPPAAIPDSAGGAIVVWSDDRNGAGDEDVFVQSVDAWGGITPSYLFEGVAVCVAPGAQTEPSVADDAAGGFYVAWTDARNDTLSGSDVYLQHFTKYGAVWDGWPGNGIPVCVAPGDQCEPALVADRAGGAIVVWRDFRAGATADLYALRVRADGTLPPGWSADGNVVCDAPDDQDRQTAVEDGTGGAYVAWRDARDATTAGGRDIFLVRFTGDGDAAYGWNAGGDLLSTPGADVGSPSLGRTDPASVVVAWAENPGKGTPTLRAQRVEQAPDVVVPWVPGGIGVGVAADPDHPPALLADGAGGAFVAWNDPTGNGIDVRGQRIGADGAPARFWPPGGVVLTSAPGSQWLPLRTRGGAPNAAIVSDGQGGAMVAWTDGGGDPDSNLYAQRVTANALVAPADPPYCFECSPRYVKRAYPNPTRGPFAVEAWIPHETSVARFDVFDVHGRRVRTTTRGDLPAPGFLTLDVDLKGLPTGVYFVRFGLVGLPEGTGLGTWKVVLAR